MAYTQADLDRIKSAIATGELEVELEGKRVKYRSINELLAAKDIIQSELEANGIVEPRRLRTSFAQFSKG